MAKEYPPVIGVAEAAEILGISTRFCYDLTHRADFPAFKLGSRTRISYQRLLEWADRQALNGVSVC